MNGAPERKRFLLKLEYSGEFFCGWQIQDPGHEAKTKQSIQSVVEKGLAKVLGRPGERYPVKGCGRTDSGVHAEEYYCHFDYFPDRHSKALDLDRLPHGLNGVFPGGISVLEVREVASDFDCLFNIKRKTYEYRIFVRKARPAIERDRYYFVNDDPLEPKSFSLETLKKAMACFEGQFDFRNFAAADGGATTFDRQIFSAKVRVENYRSQDASMGLIIGIEITGSGFLKQMVRNMVGTAWEVAQNKMSIETLQKMLRPDENPSLSRQDGGFCVPASGLYLKKVLYS